MTLVEHVEECLRRHQLEQTTGVVAVSGGPDSVALAHVLVTILRSGQIERLILAHVNHQLRGDESDEDERFVQPMFVGEPRVTTRTTRIDMAAIASAERDNLESVARRERYQWLAQVAREEKAAWIATGHTADDQAETVLFRLLRGSGVRGLAGMSECRPCESGVVLVRPFLKLRRQAVLHFLSANQFPYRVDSSNRDMQFTRNKLRLELLPILERDYNPAVVDVLCSLADQARDLDEAMVERALCLLRDAELPRAGNVIVLAQSRLQGAPVNDVREMFRALWQREGWPMGAMDFARWQRLAEIAAGTLAAFDFPGKIHVRRVGNVIQVRASAQSS